MSKKPTVEEVIDLVAQQTENWSSAHSNMETWETWAEEGADVPRVPDGYSAFKQPLNYIIKGAVSQLVTHVPKVEVKPSRKGDVGRQAAEKVKAFAEQNLKWMDWQNRSSVTKEIARNGLLKGISVLRGPIFDKSAWGTEPERKKFTSDEDFREAMEEYQAIQESTWPYVFQAIDPVTASPFDDGIGIVIKYEREVADLQRAFPNWDRGNRKLTSTVQYSEYYDGNYRCFLVNSEPLLKGGVQRCTVVPYQWAFSTFGNNSRGAKPEERAVGLLANLENTLEQINNLMTAHIADLGNRVYGQYKQILGDTVEWGRGGPGNVVTVDREDSVSELRQPGVPQDFTLALGYLQNIVETNTYARALLGMSQAPTATQQGMTLAQARLIFAPFLAALERMLAEALTKTCYDLKRSLFISSIPLGNNVTIRPADIKQPVLIEVDLMPVDPEKDDRLQQAGMQHIAHRSLSLRTVQDDFFKKDPDEEMENILVESTLQTKPVQEAIVQMAIEKATQTAEMGRADDLRKRLATGAVAPLPPQQVPAPTLQPDVFAAQKKQGRIMPGQEGALDTTSEQVPKLEGRSGY
jgi:hypothetical protein